MDIDSKELAEYIKSTITSIKNGVDGTGFRIIKPVEFNVAIINTTESGGGLRIYIAKAEGKLKAEEISHIKFEIEPENKVHIFRPNNGGFKNSCK
ncbi:MAG: hypothetical protein UV88_C0008G0006 [Parcubacteria group bacterium GW2011_GWA1_43_21]|uniref:Uncharacterized protein n=1 Tax=Candidatus Vogelbacteria bacterium RIFOXYB1_FULL_42_16 TaxID=1802436 RepID=A0A1G2QEV1_9BACT|nr:MAG: hypothetical protein UV50_C0014G0007 [Parcubacteria group bacterium GW2011_GWB1_42_9]KKT09522.1 MAG: hypothetical protein UV88_C0008G0006 [Parcubacteria group bacterium GW2011_GWA1_43_21]OHA59104.1 MAG: hypothetical protein A2370_02860 [Candidatus Vogelbacteria bacterium RIFOXYB1_FULL_42_16]